MTLLLTFNSMLSVMTMNVGYFLSVLGGTFLGSLAVGRYATGAVTDRVRNGIRIEDCSTGTAVHRSNWPGLGRWDGRIGSD
jgi:hypothetical protein